MPLTFRPAIAHDAETCAPLIYSAAPELFDHLYACQGKTAQEFIYYGFERDTGFNACSLHTVAELDGEVVGVGAFYSLRQYPRLVKENLLDIARFYRGIAIPRVMRRFVDAGSLVRAPRLRSLYIANLGVREDSRGQGIGQALLEHELTKARQRRFHQLSLDVAVTNPRAEALYHRLGFRHILTKQFKRLNTKVPDGKLMVLGL